MMVSVKGMSTLFSRSAGFEHFQHSIGNQESTDDIAGGGYDRNRPQNGHQRALSFSSKDNRANYGDGIKSVGERHQRGMQQRRNTPNHLQSDKRREHEYVQACE